MINFLIEFILWLFISSLFCNGWFLITRGYYVELPDGTSKTDGQIFGFWERFWENQTASVKVFFSHAQTEKKYHELVYMKKELADKVKFYFNFFQAKEQLTDKEIISIEGLLSCKLEIPPVGFDYYLYYEKPVYKFPMWIQKPVSRCVICYSSVYGTVLWVCFCQQKGLFDWFYYKKVAYILFYFIFIVSLAWVNSFLSKKNK